jgi:hypothetical protein
MPALPPITTTVCPSSSGARRPGAIVDSAVIVPPRVKLGPVSNLGKLTEDGQLALVGI